MPTPVATARLCLTQESGEALDAAVSVARRRGHAQTTSLHAVSALLSLPSSSLREACTRARTNSYSSRMQFKALELCLSVSLDRLPSSAQRPDEEPPVSNSLMAAIKRSQANQRRQPENFYVYQQQQQQQSLVSSVKVELQNLIISILDDPVVSRVFGEAGFRNCDIKLAILRPINQLFRYKRATPMFLCNLGDEFDMGFRGFSFPFSGYNWSCYEDDNFKKIREILVRTKWRNPILVGVSALEVLKNFLETVQRKRLGVDFPVQLSGLTVISMENEVSKIVAGSWDLEMVKSRFSEVGKLVEQSTGPGVVISFGNLKALVSEDGACVDALSFIVSELSRLLEIHGGRVWLIGVALEYDTYLKFVKGFPSVEKDWDLQLLTITCPKSSIGETYPRSSLTESFVPLGGFFATPSDMKGTTKGSTQCASRCHLCNDKCNQEIAALSNDGFTASVAYQFPSSLPTWLEKPEFDAVRGADMKVNDSMVLSAQVARLQKKWDNICQRLHYAPFLAKPICSQAPTVMGFQVAQNNLSGHNNADASSTISGCNFRESSRLTEAKANAKADASTPRAVISKSMSVKFSENEESDELGGLRSPHQGLSNSSVGEGLTSPTSVASVTTDIGLGINLSTHRVIVKSSTQSHGDPMQNFSCNFPAKSDVNAATITTHASNCSSSPMSGCFYGQLDRNDFKNLYTFLSGKIGCQEEATTIISRTIARRRSVHEKQQGASRGDIWFNFLGPDRLCKKRTAIALAEILYGRTESIICVNLSFEDGRNYTDDMLSWQEKNNCDTNFRGKTIVDHIADELRKNPLSVVYLEDVDKSDPQVQNSLSYALKTGRFSDSHGREVSIGNAVFVTTSRTIKGNTSVSIIKETFSYLEENVLSTKRRPFQIQIGFDLGDDVISQNSKVLNNNTRKGDSTPVVMNKRKLVSPNGIIGQHKTSEVVKRAHTTLKVSLDLNLPAEESEATHLENLDGDPLSDNSNAWLQDFIKHVDETIIFKPFDFDALAEEKLKVITQCFHNVVGSEGSLEIDSQVMDQILAAVYLSDSSSSSSSKVDEWINQVLGQAFVEAHKRYNLTSRSVVKLVTCEGEEQAPGIFLPAGIIMT